MKKCIVIRNVEFTLYFSLSIQVDLWNFHPMTFVAYVKKDVVKRAFL